MKEERSFHPLKIGCYAGWERYEGNPLIGERIGNVSDPCVIRKDGQFLMYYTQRFMHKILVAACEDGVSFRPFSHDYDWADGLTGAVPPRQFYADGGDYGYALGRHPDWGWETGVGQPAVVCAGDTYHMWYTAQRYDPEAKQYGNSCIGHSVSRRGHTWHSSPMPVLVPDQPWEQTALSSPSVLYDEANRRFCMWYSAGEDGIGYACSEDGERWTKEEGPVLTHQGDTVLERERIGECSVLFDGGWYYMFYTAWQDAAKGRICLARSRDGLRWERHPSNPIATWGSFGMWDVETVMTPYPLHVEGKWYLYYTGRTADRFAIGCLIHEGDSLGFDA